MVITGPAVTNGSHSPSRCFPKSTSSEKSFISIHGKMICSPHMAKPASSATALVMKTMSDTDITILDMSVAAASRSPLSFTLRRSLLNVLANLMKPLPPTHTVAAQKINHPPMNTIRQKIPVMPQFPLLFGYTMPSPEHP